MIGILIVLTVLLKISEGFSEMRLSKMGRYFQNDGS